jgi:hypothetical protein
MARRVWVLPPSWPFDPNGEDGTSSEDLASDADTEQRRRRLRHRGRERSRPRTGRSPTSEAMSSPQEPDT